MNIAQPARFIPAHECADTHYFVTAAQVIGLMGQRGHTIRSPRRRGYGVGVGTGLVGGSVVDEESVGSSAPGVVVGPVGSVVSVGSVDSVGSVVAGGLGSPTSGSPG
ncbi:MAG: hypothetical protein M3381_09645, partial [Actinomycetota bacterium]|nr:hypothetical protein [Actinomycetota bacterium]